MKKSINLKKAKNEKYTSKLHDQSVKDILGKGLFAEDFCALHEICRSTYFSWIKKHSSFKKAVDKGKVSGEAKWARMPLKYQEKSYSYPYWSSVMKNKFGWGREKIKGITGKEEPLELLIKTIAAFTSGEIADTQADKLTAMALAKIKGMQFDNHEERLKKLEEKNGIR